MKRIAFSKIDDCDVIWYITHPIGFIRDTAKEIKWFVQRGLYGYAECDTWSLDHYLCCWMPSAIRKLAGFGHPASISQEEWDEILHRIADGLERHANPWELDNADIEESETFELLGKWFHSMWT